MKHNLNYILKARNVTEMARRVRCCEKELGELIKKYNDLIYQHKRRLNYITASILMAKVDGFEEILRIY